MQLPHSFQQAHNKIFFVSREHTDIATAIATKLDLKALTTDIYGTDDATDFQTFMEDMLDEISTSLKTTVNFTDIQFSTASTQQADTATQLGMQVTLITPNKDHRFRTAKSLQDLCEENKPPDVHSNAHTEENVLDKVGDKEKHIMSHQEMQEQTRLYIETCIENKFDNYLETKKSPSTKELEDKLMLKLEVKLLERIEELKSDMDETFRVQETTVDQKIHKCQSKCDDSDLVYNKFLRKTEALGKDVNTCRSNLLSMQTDRKLLSEATAKISSIMAKTEGHLSTIKNDAAEVRTQLQDAKIHVKNIEEVSRQSM